MPTVYRKCTNTLIHREIDDECVLLDRDSGQIHHLNPAASCIWREMADDTTIDAMAGILLKHFRIDPDTAMNDAGRFIQELSELRLLEQSEQ